MSDYNATETRRQINRARNLIHDAEERITELTAERGRLLVELPTAPSAIRESVLRERLAEVEQELTAARLERGQLADQVEALSATLPTPLVAAAAEEQCEELAAEATAAAGDAVDSWTVFAAALGDLYEAAERFTEADAKRTRAVRKRRDHAEALGILDRLPALDLPAISAEERRAALALLAGALQGGAHDADKQLRALLDPLKQRLAESDPEAEDLAAPELPFTPAGEGDPLRSYVVGAEVAGAAA